MDITIKLALLGDSGVGKTSLITQYVQKKFEHDYKPTLGVNIVAKELVIDEFNCQLVLWDIAGQDKYDFSRKMFFQGCIGALCVYDITRIDTLTNIASKWVNDIKEFGKDATFLLIGNKDDLQDSKTITTEQGQKLADEINAIEFIETSAKSGNNVEQAFKTLVIQVLRRLKKIA